MSHDHLDRRSFLGFCAGLLSAAIIKPAAAFVPPRAPFVHVGRGLDGIYSHLGVLPVSPELGVREGQLLEIRDWDGVGYPCLVRNVCCGANAPEAVIYDFDLWNFRHDDGLHDAVGRDAYNREVRRYNSLSGWYAHRRFGDDAVDIIRQGGGWLAKRLDRFPTSLIPIAATAGSQP